MKNKKGISLIVLIITIIVMIILAGAIILTISNSEILSKATTGVEASNLKQLEAAATIAYADLKLANPAI